MQTGHYCGTIFHRVIPGFMIQCGGYTQDLNRKSSESEIMNESDNGLSNKKGTVAMARSSDPDSATCEFFINLVDNFFLDYVGPRFNEAGYCVFGEVVEGEEIIEKIASTETESRVGHDDVPVEPITILSANIAQ